MKKKFFACKIVFALLFFLVAGNWLMEAVAYFWPEMSWKERIFGVITTITLLMPTRKGKRPWLRAVSLFLLITWDWRTEPGKYWISILLVAAPMATLAWLWPHIDGEEGGRHIHPSIARKSLN